LDGRRYRARPIRGLRRKITGARYRAQHAVRGGVIVQALPEDGQALPCFDAQLPAPAAQALLPAGHAPEAAQAFRHASVQASPHSHLPSGQGHLSQQTLACAGSALLSSGQKVIEVAVASTSTSAKMVVLFIMVRFL